MADFVAHVAHVAHVSHVAHVAHVALGESRTPVGQLRFTHAGPRQFSTFAYGVEWIEKAFRRDNLNSREVGHLLLAAAEMMRDKSSDRIAFY